ncbi:hypothetical protein [Wukongibacter baidiensis]
MKPFREGDTHGTFKNIVEKIKKDIDCLDNEYLLNVSKVELEEYWTSKGLINEIMIDWEEKYIDNKQSTKITEYDFFDKKPYQVSGTRFDVCIPFKGDSLLFKLRASTYSLSGYPEIEVRDNLLLIPIEYGDLNASGEEIKKIIDSNIKKIASAIDNLNRDVREHNGKISKAVSDAINKKVDKAKKSLNVFDVIGIPMKRKDMPENYVLDVKRKIITKNIEEPRISSRTYTPEPELDEEEYNHILEVMKSMSKVIERSPKTFSGLNEEDIRMHFLLQLNGHYEGSATGETFNKSGKTDILIRVKDKNVFIGECKFWKGAKSFNSAIDQLLGYLAWRDSKCALLIFNKTKNSTDVAKKMHEIMINRYECRRVVFHNLLNDSRYIFVKKDDPGREIIITTQLYDIPITS